MVGSESCGSRSNPKAPDHGALQWTAHFNERRTRKGPAWDQTGPRDVAWPPVHAAFFFWPCRRGRLRGGSWSTVMALRGAVVVHLWHNQFAKSRRCSGTWRISFPHLQRIACASFSTLRLPAAAGPCCDWRLHSLCIYPI